MRGSALSAGHPSLGKRLPDASVQQTSVLGAQPGALQDPALNPLSLAVKPFPWQLGCVQAPGLGVVGCPLCFAGQILPSSLTPCLCLQAGGLAQLSKHLSSPLALPCRGSATCFQPLPPFAWRVLEESPDRLLALPLPPVLSTAARAVL